MPRVPSSRVPAWERGTHAEDARFHNNRRTDAALAPVVDGKGCGSAKAMDRRGNERDPLVHVDHGHDTNGVRRLGVDPRSVFVLIDAIGDHMLLLPEYADEIRKGHALVVYHQTNIGEPDEPDFSAAATEPRLDDQLAMSAHEFE